MWVVITCCCTARFQTHCIPKHKNQVHVMETQIINAPNSFTDNLVNSGCNHTLLFLSRRFVSTLRSKSMTCEQDATTLMRDSLQIDPGHKLQVDATFAADSSSLLKLQVDARFENQVHVMVVETILSLGFDAMPPDVFACSQHCVCCTLDQL